jgi:hypothetical protein
MTRSFYRCQFEPGELKSVAKKKKLFHGIPRHFDLERCIQRHSTQPSISNPTRSLPAFHATRNQKRQLLTPIKKYLRAGVP